jgi:hypothetical protein
VIGEVVPVPVNPPGEDVAVKDVAEGPLPEAVNATVAVPLPLAVAAPIVGVFGANVDAKELDALDEAEVPLAFVAVTVYVYVPPTVSVIEIGLEVPVAVTVEEEVTV